MVLSDAEPSALKAACGTYEGHPTEAPLPPACQTPQPLHWALGFQLIIIPKHRKPSEKKKRSFLQPMSHLDKPR